MKGTKLFARAVRQNAKMKNASKDKPAGKEFRGRDEDRPDYVRITDQNVANVLPRLVPGRDPRRPVTAPMSDKKLARARKILGFGG